MTPPTPEPVRRELRLLKLHAVLSSVAIVVLLVALWRTPSDPGLEVVDVLDVQRINVVNESGTPALVIAGHGRLPGPTFEGTEYAQELSGGRTEASGMIFFNQRGDEVGGLTFQGRLAEEGYRASAGLMFDQFRQDQVVGIQYGDDGRDRSAGLHVWDRSTEVSIARLLELVDARRTATGAARDSVDRIIQELRASGLGAHRIFLGSRNRTATLGMEDGQGRTRLRLSVDSLGAARIEFLDEGGDVIRALPE